MLFNFGKFKGKSIEYVCNIEPSYVVWAARKGLVHINNNILNNLIESIEYDNALSEAIFESEHSDWGDRD